MKLKVLSTGSKGNAYILEAEDSTLLIEAGVSIKRIVAAVKDWREVDGCLITHEHLDHSRAWYNLGLMGVRVGMSKGMAEALGADKALSPPFLMESRQVHRLGGFDVIPFDVQHDAAEPFGYLIKHRKTGEIVVYATDTYYLRHTFPQVHYWIVECNYSEDIAEKYAEAGGSEAIVKRLKSSHMSLRRLIDILRANDLSRTRSIVLVHLSDERSDERRMVREVKHATGIEHVVAANDGDEIILDLVPF